MSDKSVFIIAGESSGEIYGARLAERLINRWPGIRVMGVGGQRMRQAGVELVAGITSAIGIVEVLKSFGEIKRTLDATVEAIEKAHPDVLVLIDYPDFNFRVARKARRMGIRVLYYVTPQVWAWRKGRVRQMAGFVDRAAVILPFEEDFLRNAGVEAEFVGHPICEEMQEALPEKHDAKERLGLDPQRPYVSFLPGSRDVELSKLLPVYLDVVDIFSREHPRYGIILSVAPNLDASKYADDLAAFRDRGVVVTSENISMLYAASDASIVASGTAAFQAVFTATPIAVVYKISPLSYFIMRKLVSLQYVNLANIILGREAVRELLQKDATAEAIAGELKSLVLDDQKREVMVRDLQEVSRMFEGRRPTERVADIIAEMAGWAA